MTDILAPSGLPARKASLREEIPTDCESCGGDLRKTFGGLVCMNPDCTGNHEIITTKPVEDMEVER